MENLSLKNWLSNDFRERYKKSLKFLCFISSLGFSCFSQINLVPNSGFEQYDTCPYYTENPIFSGAEVICKAIPWFQPCNPNVIPSSGCGNSSSDFYHACAGNIPIVWSGFDYQLPYSGEGFSGINLGGPPPPLRG